VQSLFRGSHQKKPYGDAVVIALFTRFLIWAAMTYFPQTVHHAESGLLMSSIIFAVLHVIVLVAALRESPTS
jgi:hypothetical protein